MGLTLAAIHQPLNDFFLNQFKTDASSPVHFRFDKYGSVVSDDSFLVPEHPEWGYQPSLVTEVFSDLVNHTPADAGDGLNIILSAANAVDDTYFFRLLSPSMPWLPDGLSDDAKEAVMNAFNAIKVNAKNIWDNVKAESSTGQILQFKPSWAEPPNWYDKGKSDGWAPYSFQVTDTSSAPASPLWRLKLTDAALSQALQLQPPNPEIPTPATNLATHVLTMARAATMAGHATMLSKPLPGSSSASAFSAARRNMTEMRDHEDVELNPRTVGGGATVAVGLHNALLEQYRKLPVNKRLVVDEFVGQNAPTQPPQVSSIKVSFDYCLVNIRRPWMVPSFLNQPSWYIPGVAKGGLTTSGPGGNIPFLPVGLVAIRDLVIEATWSPEDLANASMATDFGPFKVDGDIVSGKLGHQGLQIIGWLVQEMGTLPPVSDPQLAGEPPTAPLT